jgi:uncharacterized integral membrane protein
MRRFLSIVILVPLALLVIVLSVANRAPVTFSLDPFDGAAPAFATTAPFFVFLFAALLFGILLGGIAAWLRQGRWRRLARHERARADRLQREVDRLTAEAKAEGRALPAPGPARDAA